MQTNTGAELVFLPLGGSNEIGMNFNLYGYGPPTRRKWLIVDVGVTFGNLETPGVEVIVPDPTFIEQHRDDIVGIVLTHAHEDHIGALGWLWPRLKAPLYATPFTAYLIREKLREKGLGHVKVTEVALGGTLDLDPFKIELITLTHSIPEPNGLAITTPLGVILHTGDWKIDPDPVLGAPTDHDRLRRLGDEGVLAMICDSTNVFVDGSAGSEADVRTALADLVAGQRGKVAVACFASNVARLDSVCRAAVANDRRICLVGRSMHRISGAAKSIGLLKDLPEFIAENDANSFPDDKILYCCTGSQGEARAALSRIAEGTHHHVSLGEGDAVIFSSRQIPGNELAIGRLQNRLSELGVRIHTPEEHPGIHVSGHPCRDELAQMYQWARPRIAIPTHGERRHLVEHAAFAKDMQVPEAIATRNGEMIRLAPGRAQVIDEVPSGRLFVDGATLTPEHGPALKERRHAATNGMLIVSMAIDAKGRMVGELDVRSIGLAEDASHPLDEALDELAELAEDAVDKLGRAATDEEAVEAAVARALKRASQRLFDRKPIVETVVLRV